MSNPEFSTRMEAMFSAITVSMIHNSAIMNDMLTGLNTIAENTRRSSSDEEELERLRRGNNPPPTPPSPSSNGFMGALLGGITGVTSGGILGMLAGVAGFAGKALLATAFAAPIGQAAASLLGAAVGEIAGDTALGENVAKALAPNAVLGVFTGAIMGKKIGIATALIGTLLDGVVGMIGDGTGVVDFGWGDVDLNSDGIKTALGIATGLIAPALLRGIGTAVAAMISGPAGWIVGGIALTTLALKGLKTVTDKWVEDKRAETLNEIDGALKKGLTELRGERAKKGANLFGYGSEKETGDAIAYLGSLGTALGDKMWDWTDLDGSDIKGKPRLNPNSKYTEYATPLEYNPDEHSKADGEAIAKARQQAIDLLSHTQDYAQLNEGELANLLKISSLFGLDDKSKLLKDYMDKINAMNPYTREGNLLWAQTDADKKYSADMDYATMKDTDKKNNAIADFRAWYDPEADENRKSLNKIPQQSAYDKFVDSIIASTALGQDTALSSSLMYPKGAFKEGGLWNSLTEDEKTALLHLRSKDSPVWNMMPTVVAPQSTNIKQGDSITSITNNYNGQGASGDLKSNYGSSY